MRDSNGRFTRGTSGNPGGRPRGLHRVTELARERTDRAIETLTAIMEDGAAPASARVAASALLDRGWGKAPQRIDVGAERGIVGRLHEMSAAELSEYAAQLEAEIAAEQAAGAGQSEAIQ